MKERFSKDPGETYDALITYKPGVPGMAYTITELEVFAYDSAGNDVSQDILETDQHTFSADTAHVWVKGGIAGKTYKIEAFAKMATGQRLMQRLFMDVKD